MLYRTIGGIIILYEEYQKKVREMQSDEDCPVKRTIAILQGKWSAQVLFELSKEESRRFGSLQKNIDGITNTMLTSTLRDLQDKGLVTRIQYNEIPPHVEYSLTEAGKNLYSVFEAMAEWGVNYGLATSGK
jgi:DNA-binding HxlR family transcriptional regulator